jgi:transposase
MSGEAWEVSDQLWARIQPLLPHRPRRRRYPGRRRLDDRGCLNGVIYVLRTGITWAELPRQLGYGSGVTCWRRLRDWQQTGVWDRLLALLLAELRAAGLLDLGHAVIDSSHVRAKRGTRPWGQARLTEAAPAASTTCWWTPVGCRWLSG